LTPDAISAFSPMVCMSEVNLEGAQQMIMNNGQYLLDPNKIDDVHCAVEVSCPVSMGVRSCWLASGPCLPPDYAFPCSQHQWCIRTDSAAEHTAATRLRTCISRPVQLSDKHTVALWGLWEDRHTDSGSKLAQRANLHLCRIRGSKRWAGLGPFRWKMFGVTPQH